MDIEVDLGSVDHEAEDEKAMEVYQKALEAEAAEDEEKEEAADAKEVADEKPSSKSDTVVDNKQRVTSK